MRMPGKCEGPMWMGEEDSNNKLKTCGHTHLREHDIVRRVDPDGETLVWCTRCCRMGPILMNRCRPQQKDTKEHRNMVKIVFKFKRRRGDGQELQKGMVRDRNVRVCKGGGGRVGDLHAWPVRCGKYPCSPGEERVTEVNKGGLYSSRRVKAMWWATVTGRKPWIEYVNATQSELLAEMERRKGRWKRLRRKTSRATSSRRA